MLFHKVLLGEAKVLHEFYSYGFHPLMYITYVITIDCQDQSLELAL